MAPTGFSVRPAELLQPQISGQQLRMQTVLTTAVLFTEATKQAILRRTKGTCRDIPRQHIPLSHLAGPGVADVYRQIPCPEFHVFVFDQALHPQITRRCPNHNSGLLRHFDTVVHVAVRPSLDTDPASRETDLHPSRIIPIPDVAGNPNRIRLRPDNLNFAGPKSHGEVAGGSLFRFERFRAIPRLGERGCHHREETGDQVFHTRYCAERAHEVRILSGNGPVAK